MVELSYTLQTVFKFTDCQTFLVIVDKYNESYQENTE